LPPVESGRGHPKGRAMVRPNARLTWRLKRQRLDRRAPRGEALCVVREICGLHAQVMSSAELTLWARVEDLEPEAVQEALWKRRSLAKTWAMRGTLHLLPADELPTGVAAQGALRPRYETASWQRHFGLTREEAEAMFAGIADALDGRSPGRSWPMRKSDGNPLVPRKRGRILSPSRIAGRTRR
jgi:Winged helix DNA-binding domain